MRETAFHLNDEFFEEILNGIPDKNKKRPEKEFTKTALTSDNVTRIKYVAKEFLYDQESKDFFIKIIQNAKYRNQLMLAQKTEMMSVMSMMDFDDEDTLLLKSLGDTKESSSLNKIQDVKEKFKSAKSIFESLQSLKGDFIRAKATLNRLFVNTSTFYKAEREMYEFIEGPTTTALNSTITPILNTYVFPSVKHSILQFKDVTRVILRRFFLAFRKEMTWQINRFMAETGLIQALDKTQILSKGAIMTKISYYATKFSNIYTKFKRYRTLYQVGSLGMKAGAIYLFGYKIDDEEKRKIDSEIENIARKSKAYGAQLREGAIKDYDVEDYKEKAFSLVDTYVEKKFGFTISDIKDGLENFSWEDLNVNSSFNKKRIYAINLSSIAFFDKLDDSHLSALTKLHIRVVNHFQFAFDKIFERLNASNEYNSVVLSKNSLGDLIPLDYELLFSNVKKNLKNDYNLDFKKQNKSKVSFDSQDLILRPKTEVIKTFITNEESKTVSLSKTYRHSFDLFRKEGGILIKVPEKEINRVIISSEGKILNSKVTDKDINNKINKMFISNSPTKKFVNDIFEKKSRLGSKNEKLIPYSVDVIEDSNEILNIQINGLNTNFDIVDLMSYENRFLEQTITITNGLIEKIWTSTQFLNKLKHEY